VSTNKLELQDVEFTVVPDNFRLRTADYGKLPVVEALLEGKTISVPIETSTAKLYRFAKANGYVLRKHSSKTVGLILWFDKVSERVEKVTESDA
jgi:hypothetical protein